MDIIHANRSNIDPVLGRPSLTLHYSIHVQFEHCAYYGSSKRDKIKENESFNEYAQKRGAMVNRVV